MSHPDSLAALSNLVRTAGAHPPFAPEAEAMLQRVARLCAGAVGDKHPHTRTAKAALASWRRAVGGRPRRHAAALAAAVDRNDGAGGAHGTDETDETSRRRGIDETDGMVGPGGGACASSEARARRDFDEAFALLRAAHGEAHPETLSLLEAETERLHDAGRPAEAEPLARALVGTCAARYGEGHTLTVRYSWMLAVLLRHQGKLDEAAAITGDWGFSRPNRDRPAHDGAPEAAADHAGRKLPSRRAEREAGSPPLQTACPHADALRATPAIADLPPAEPSPDYS